MLCDFLKWIEAAKDKKLGKETYLRGNFSLSKL